MVSTSPEESSSSNLIRSKRANTHSTGIERNALRREPLAAMPAGAATQDFRLDDLGWFAEPFAGQARHKLRDVNVGIVADRALALDRRTRSRVARVPCHA
mgnify:CR=1 FL=1